MVATLPEGVLSRADLRVPRCLAKYDVLAGQLKNGIKFLLLSSEDVLVSGFGLAVGFGAYDSDKEYAGLPHLLEHMVLLGSEKFPGPHSWQAFVDTYGSATNASTHPRATHYWATVGADRLYQVAERIVDFVRAPELNPEYLEKTIDVVNSEAEMRYKNDAWRRDDLERALANPHHPASIFTIGSVATLNKPGVGEALRSFHQTYYKPERMSVVAVSSLPVAAMYENLENLLLTIPPSAGNCPERPIGRMFGYPEPLYRPEDLNKYVKLIPISEGTKELSFEFVVADVRDTYRTMPHFAVTGLLGQEDAGSLTAYFKKAGVASGLCAGLKNVDIGGTRLYVALDLVKPEITADLVKLVGRAIFAYVRLCLEEGPPDVLVKEKIRSAEIRWDNQSTRDVTELLETNNLQMTSFPLEEVFTAGNTILEESYEANHRSVVNLLESLTLDSLLVFASTVGFTSSDCPKVADHFGTQYNVEQLPAAWLEEWRSVLTMPWGELKRQLKEWDLYLPRPNPYIPESLDVVPIATSLDDLPAALDADPLWIHKLETFFNVPLIEIRTFIRLPCLVTGPLAELPSPVKIALVAIYMYSALEAANEDLQCAIEADLRGGLTMTSAESHRMGEPAVEIVISGLSDKAPKLFAVIMQHLAEWKVRDEHIVLALQRYSDNIKERITQRRPLDDVFPNLYEAWYPDFVPEDDVLPILETLDVAKVRHCLCGSSEGRTLKPEFIKDAQVKSIIMGNVTRGDATSKYMNKRVLGPFYNPIPREKRLPLAYPVDVASLELEGADGDQQTMFHLSVEPSTSDALNSAVFIVWQMPDMSPATRAIEAITRRWLDRIMYDELRTEESLGYVVLATVLPNTGMGMLVQSEKPASTVLERMLQFVRERVLAKSESGINYELRLSPTEFSDFKNSTLLQYQEPPISLQVEVSQCRRELLYERNQFDVRTHQVKFLQNLQYEDYAARVGAMLRRPWTVITVESNEKGAQGPVFQCPEWIRRVPLSSPSELLDRERNTP